MIGCVLLPVPLVLSGPGLVTGAMILDVMVFVPLSCQDGSFPLWLTLLRSLFTMVRI